MLVIGVFSIVESLLGGICLIAISSLLLPPIKNFVYSKTNKELPFKTKIFLIFLFFIASIIFSSQSQEKRALEFAAEQSQKQAEKLAKIRQENISNFNVNHDQIISSVKDAFSA
jgi:hypothetical protein